MFIKTFKNKDGIVAVTDCFNNPWIESIFSGFATASSSLINFQKSDRVLGGHHLLNLRGSQTEFADIFRLHFFNSFGIKPQLNQTCALNPLATSLLSRRFDRAGARFLVKFSSFSSHKSSR
jgi:hypothetical protein